MKAFSAIQIGGRILTLVLIILLVHAPDDAPLIIAIQGTVSLVAGFVSVWLLHRDGILIWSRPSARDIFEEIKEGSAIFLSTTAIGIYVNLTPVILGFLAGPVAVGQFALADRIRQAAQSVLQPVSTALFPRISRLVASDPRSAAPLLKISGIGLVVISTGITGALWVLAPQFVVLIGGQQFAAAAEVLRWLAFLPVVMSFSTFLGLQILLPNKRTKAFNTILVSGGILSLVIIAPLIKTFGPEGAAMTLLIVEGFVSLSMVIYVLKTGYFRGIGIRASRPHRPDPARRPCRLSFSLFSGSGAAGLRSGRAGPHRPVLLRRPVRIVGGGAAGPDGRPDFHPPADRGGAPVAAHPSRARAGGEPPERSAARTAAGAALHLSPRLHRQHSAHAASVRGADSRRARARDRRAMAPLAPSTQNISQLAYLAISVMTTLTASVGLRSARVRAVVPRAILAGCLVTVGTGLLDYASNFVPLDVVLDAFRTATLCASGGRRGSGRAAGRRPDAGSVCLRQHLRRASGAAVFRTPRLSGLRSDAPSLAARLRRLAVFAIMSSSSAAYVGLGVFLASVGLEWIWRVMRFDQTR